MKEVINIKNLNLDELTGVVNLYPWYGEARKELCLRMIKIGGNAWGKKNFADSALYIGTRKKISEIYRITNNEDYKDYELENLVRSYINKDKKDSTKYNRTVKIIGGDYFSKSDYERATISEDKIFATIAKTHTKESSKNSSECDISKDFYTETLARIYLEQGHYDQAKNIYSALRLKFPEKNAYFASLINKIDELTNN